MNFEPGDRVRLTGHDRQDYLTIPIGTSGTVLNKSKDIASKLYTIPVRFDTGYAEDMYDCHWIYPENLQLKYFKSEKPPLVEPKQFKIGGKN